MSKNGKVHAIILHCSDSDHQHHDNVETLHQWHVVERGFSQIGYHYVITKDGKAHATRDESVQGAHCKDGGMNRGTIGICLTGKHGFSVAQFRSLAELVRNMLEKYKLNDMDVYGHNAFSSKTCPNFSVQEFKDKYLKWRQ